MPTTTTARRCGECSTVVGDSGILMADGRYSCPSCWGVCDSCDERYLSGDLYDIRGGRSYCYACTRECDGCDVRVHPDDDYCEECTPDDDYDDSRVAGYRHTRPTMWLGGPLPKDHAGHQVGFYVGFELEVSSDNYSPGSLFRWASEHLGAKDAFDCKSDSSVRGFEIATQPMTPEFFESVDWESFMEVLNRDHRTTDTSPSREPVGHGLHVHIGRVAFDRDDVAEAMFCFLLGQGRNLERIGRREPTGYCAKVKRPIGAALVNQFSRDRTKSVQARRLYYANAGAGRDAINLSNNDTIEIRAFRSTRDADHLRAAVRMVYLAARYVAHLREKRQSLISPKALHWSSFIEWVERVHPDAAAALREPQFPDFS